MSSPSMKKPIRSKLIKEADKKYSLHVRQKYANSEGYVQCYTCNYLNHWKKMQCGHYIPRFFKYTRWELDNLRVQCYMCNMRLGGVPHIFRENLVEELGDVRVQQMEASAKPLFREKDEWILNKINAI